MNSFSCLPVLKLTRMSRRKTVSERQLKAIHRAERSSLKNEIATGRTIRFATKKNNMHRSQYNLRSNKKKSVVCSIKLFKLLTVCCTCFYLTILCEICLLNQSISEYLLLRHSHTYTYIETLLRDYQRNLGKSQIIWETSLKMRNKFDYFRFSGR